MAELDPATLQALEAAAFRRLRDHLQDRIDVQNIDLMNMAGFCRNCLSRWMFEAAVEQGVALDKDAAKTLVYGMPYEDWKALHQAEASDGQKAAFAESIRAHEGPGAD
ncbi:DUF1244 domain-containing protein [Gemmobacter aquarius]|uniref:DUF1244 domain-containing protein n=1 Tax=Paragemmobacter aquarius TaxID=2169400 RepID=A0A2S0UPV7_9RHOB|nr:DUF1244 domain-containing protein [Gemmobacter aquarius]AWB49837.1 DUF1244 domain-containing protein [Gemmobacter aquarius]